MSKYNKPYAAVLGVPNVLGGGGIIAGPTDPQPLLWLRADDVAGSDGSSVAVWTSREGYGYKFSQSTGTKQPTLKTGANGINSQPVVRGDGGDILVLNDALSTSETGTLFAVYRVTNVGSYYRDIMVSSGTANDTTYAELRAFGDPSNKHTFWRVRDADTNVSTPYDGVDIAINTPYLVVVGSRDFQGGMILNGAMGGTAAGMAGDWFADVTGRTNTTLLGRLGATEGNWLVGDVAEIILYDSLLTWSEILAIETYLATRYGITLNTPDTILAPFTPPFPGSVEEMNIQFDAADVDSSGNIYAGVSPDYSPAVKKSTDGGATWGDDVAIDSNWNRFLRVFVDSRDYVYVSGIGTSNPGLYRSIDGGDTFARVLTMDSSTGVWGIDEDASGDLYAGEYSSGTGNGQMQIWKSTDDGATWAQVYVNDRAGTQNDHIHDLRVSPATGYIYATSGDLGGEDVILRSVDSGANWTEIYNGSIRFVPLAFNGGYVYIGSDDSYNYIYRIPDNTDATVTPEIVYTKPPGYESWFFSSSQDGDYILFGQADGRESYLLIAFDGTNYYEAYSDAAALASEGFWTISRNNNGGVFYVGRPSSAMGLKVIT